jgi:hypothetical protein
VIATMMIAGVLFILIIVLVPTVIDSVSGNGQFVDIEQTVRADEIDSLPIEKDGCSDPECVVLGREIPVEIVVLNGSGQQIALDRLRTLLGLGMGLVTIWILRNLIGSVRKNEPFSTTNVKRLRQLGLVLLVGWPAVEIANNFITGGLADTTATGSLGSSWNIPPAPEAMLGGLIVLILAEVFAHGLRLREDVEGTV